MYVCLYYHIIYIHGCTTQPNREPTPKGVQTHPTYCYSFHPAVIRSKDSRLSHDDHLMTFDDLIRSYPPGNDHITYPTRGKLGKSSTQKVPSWKKRKGYICDRFVPRVRLTPPSHENIPSVHLAISSLIYNNIIYNIYVFSICYHFYDFYTVKMPKKQKKKHPQSLSAPFGVPWFFRSKVPWASHLTWAVAQTEWFHASNCLQH